MKGAADGAFIHPTIPGDLGNGPLMKIVGSQGLPLQVRQLLLNDPLDPFELYLPGQTGP